MNHGALSSFLRSFVQSRPNFGINILRVGSAVQNGETVTFGSNVFEVDFTGDRTLTAGRIRVDLSGSGTLAAATKTGTFSGTGTDGDTITAGGKTYRLKDTPAAINDVQIGGDAATTRDNFVAAVMAAAGAGTKYFTGTTANANVTAAASSTADVILTAIAAGTVGNSIAISENGTGFSFAGGATALSGGVDATAAEFTTALAAADPVNVDILRISANEVLFTDRRAAGSAALACSETLAGSNNAWAAAATFGGRGRPAFSPQFSSLSRVPTATEVALGNMHFVLPFTPSLVIPLVKVTATGAIKAFDGAITINTNRVTFTNSGSTSFAATDTVQAFIQE